jgi:hypothetical protein
LLIHLFGVQLERAPAWVGVLLLLIPVVAGASALLLLARRRRAGAARDPMQVRGPH